MGNRECSGECVRSWAEVGVAQDTPAEAESHSGMWVGSLSAPQLKPWGKGLWYFGREGKVFLPVRSVASLAQAQDGLLYISAEAGVGQDTPTEAFRGSSSPLDDARLHSWGSVLRRDAAL